MATGSGVVPRQQNFGKTCAKSRAKFARTGTSQRQACVRTGKVIKRCITPTRVQNSDDISMQENIPEAPVVKVLHAGSLTTLVRQELGPALYQGSGIALESEPGHSVALAMALKEGRTRGDVYLSADAEVNRILLEPINGRTIGWFVIFA